MKIKIAKCKTEPFFTAQYDGKVHPNNLLKIYYPYTRCVDIYKPIIYRGVSCSLPRCLSPERTCDDCYFSC